MPSNVYHFVTPWFIPGATLEQVWPLISDAATFPTWWPSVFLEATPEAGPGDGGPIGQRYRYHTKGRLPYHLRWTAEVTAIEPPTMIEISATGDFSGVGRWTLQQHANAVTARLDWDVRADLALLKALSPVLKPLFSWNHQWAMKEGEKGLIMHLGRQRLAAR